MLAPCTDLPVGPELALLYGLDIGDSTAARKGSSLRKKTPETMGETPAVKRRPSAGLVLL